MKIHQTIRVESTGRVAHVILNRPEVRNSFDPFMIRELTDAFREIGSRSDVSVLVLRGEGKSFCSGADLNYMKSMASYSFEENEKDADRLFEMFWQLRSCPQPVVGLVQGHVMGGALGLLALCDIGVAVDGTQFCFSEVRLGLAPAVISPFVLEKIPKAYARRYFLTGEVFDSAVASEMGLIQHVGGDAPVFTENLVRTLLANGPEALRATKRLLESEQDWEKARRFTSQLIAARRVSSEGQEGLRGFLEKRDPSWRTEK